jgi:integrase/recombinase XerD
MPRKGQRLKHRKVAWPKPQLPRSEHADPLGHLALTAYMQAHFEWMAVTGYAEDTIRARRTALRRFIAWCEERALRDPKDITKPVLERYQRHLFYYRKADGRPMTLGTQFGCLAPLKTFFKWLAKENHILYNPASELTLPKLPKHLPRDLIRPRGRGDLARSGADDGRRLARSRDAGDPLLDGVAAHGAAGTCAV